MAQNYEDIVREWYERLFPEFISRLTAKYGGLTLYDAENLYQDTFLAVHENLAAGRVREDTSWRSYIMTIGLNLAGKEWRKVEKTDSVDKGFDAEDGAQSAMARKVEEQLKTLPDGDDEMPLCNNPEVKAILGDEILHTPEPCNSILRLYYYEGKKMKQIAEQLGYKNDKTAKSKKCQCMDDLIKRLTDSLNRAGYDVKPKKHNSNGKN